jgi:hypothetical protein
MVAFYLDRQTYNAVGLKFNYEFYQSEQIFQYLELSKRHNTHSCLSNLDFMLNYKLFYKYYYTLL